jgi:hypothetical protein
LPRKELVLLFLLLRVQVQALALQEPQVAGFLSLLQYMQEQLPAQAQVLLVLLALLLWKRVR